MTNQCRLEHRADQSTAGPHCACIDVFAIHSKVCAVCVNVHQCAATHLAEAIAAPASHNLPMMVQLCKGGANCEPGATYMVLDTPRCVCKGFAGQYELCRQLRGGKCMPDALESSANAIHVHSIDHQSDELGLKDTTC